MKKKEYINKKNETYLHKTSRNFASHNAQIKKKHTSRTALMPRIQWYRDQGLKMKIHAAVSTCTHLGGLR
jgi:hypothetical protein